MLQRSDEWFAIRAGKITASRVSDLMAKTKTGPSASRKNLITLLAVERLTGQCVETHSNAAMQRGVELEDEAIQAYENQEMVAVEAVGFVVHPTLPYVGVSPDGCVGDDGLIEAKCPYAMAKHYEALRYGAHADEYRWQLQAQLWVTGRQWVDAVSYDPRFTGFELAIVRVTRDEKAIAELEAECIAGNAEIELQLAWFEQQREAA
jgi:putative phage-type endonuclease